MHRIGKLGLQVFAAPDNMTGQAQIQVKAREIDFVTSFGKNIQALLDVLGIIRMIKKDNNTVLKTKKVTGNLQSGEVAEGEEIPYSQYAVEEIPFDTIKISNFSWSVQDLNQRILPDTTTNQPLLHGIVEVTFLFS